MDRMGQVVVLDRVERIARSVMWLSIGATFAICPVVYVRFVSNETKLQTALNDMRKQDDEKIAILEKKEKDERVSIAQVGRYMSAIDYGTAFGEAWFTNVSSREGPLCVSGIAHDSTSKAEARSLPSCAPLNAYGSAHMKFMFAGSELKAACPHTDCAMKIVDELPPHN